MTLHRFQFQCRRRFFAYFSAIGMSSAWGWSVLRPGPAGCPGVAGVRAAERWGWWPSEAHHHQWYVMRCQCGGGSHTGKDSDEKRDVCDRARAAKTPRLAPGRFMAQFAADVISGGAESAGNCGGIWMEVHGGPALHGNDACLISIFPLHSTLACRSPPRVPVSRCITASVAKNSPSKARLRSPQSVHPAASEIRVPAVSAPHQRRVPSARSGCAFALSHGHAE